MLDYRTGIQVLEIDHPLIDLVDRLRYKNANVHRHYKTPWPKHCYMPMVVPWAVTKAGSRRRRGYNVDSSWTEVALSRWLVPHGRSAS